jgi:hypothetical protein
MPVTVTDLRTTVDEGDSATNYNQGLAVTNAFAEAPYSIGVSNSSLGSLDDIYWTGTSIDLSNELIYVQSLLSALANTWTAAAHALYLGDGTDGVALHQEGGDRVVFRHSDGQVLFSSFVLDGSYYQDKLNSGEYTVRTGDTSLTMSAITQIGATYRPESKALGGGYNEYLDIIRYGNKGLMITGGTGDTPGTFFDIAVLDRSTAEDRGHGIIREYSSGIYGLQGPLNFGDSTGVSWFEESNFSLIFENRDIGDSKYFLKVTGDTAVGDSTWFKIDSATITTAGPNVYCDFSHYGIDDFAITNCNITGLSNFINFAGDSLAFSHTVTGNTFNAIGQIDPRRVIFQNNTITNSITDGDGGAILLDADGTAQWANLSFISSGDSGHAIYISTAGSYTLSNFTYSGYALQTGDSRSRAVYNNSGGAVTLTISGGETPSYWNGVSATTTIVTDPVSTQLTVFNTDGDTISGARCLVYVTTGDNFPYGDTIIAEGDTGDSVVTVTHPSHGLATGDNVIIKGAAQNVYNGAYTITVVTGDTYTYVSGDTYLLISPATPESGDSITSTFAFISGTTNSQGKIGDTRPVAISQPITGWVRKSSGSPYYRESAVTGTVNNSTGFTANIQLISDE